jgi:flagellar motility protein MotE (MotC chaperone)
MNELFVYQIAVICNAVVVVASTLVAFKYYLATRELHQALHKQSEQDGQRYAQSFQAQLWQEKRLELEKELTAYKKAHEKACRDLIDLQERFNGLEQAYHESRKELSANGILISQAQAEENKAKRKGKK